MDYNPLNKTGIHESILIIKNILSGKGRALPYNEMAMDKCGEKCLNCQVIILSP